MYIHSRFTHQLHGRHACLLILRGKNRRAYFFDLTALWILLDNNTQKAGWSGQDTYSLASPPISICIVYFAPASLTAIGSCLSAYLQARQRVGCTTSGQISFTGYGSDVYQRLDWYFFSISNELGYPYTQTYVLCSIGGITVKSWWSHENTCPANSNYNRHWNTKNTIALKLSGRTKMPWIKS